MKLQLRSDANAVIAEVTIADAAVMLIGPQLSGTTQPQKGAAFLAQLSAMARDYYKGRHVATREGAKQAEVAPEVAAATVEFDGAWV